ncbi:hypothetical protein KY339_01105 [Candidatus Woesearchaeota archaeon]|nr:hypothetical protein [Candidatus Woesearchaeota archaeon]
MPKKIAIAEITDNGSINIALDTIKINKQALIFVNTKKGAEKHAEDISKKIKQEPKEAIELSEKILHVLSTPTIQCKRLAKCVRKGLAFHHAGLNSEQKTLVENAFRQGKIKIICATPTLAFGLDLPAYRAVIRDLKRYGGPYGMHDIPVLEFHQMAGRAGRPSYDKEGQAICLAKTESEKKEILKKFILGEPEAIYSKLAVEPVFRTYLLSLIATKFVNNKKEILDFFEKTFWAHQYEDMEKLERIIEKMLNLLEEYEFIKISEKSDDFVSAAEVFEGKIKATLLGERVAQLYLDPLTANMIIESLRKASSTSVKAFSFLHLVSSCLEMRPLLRVKTREFDIISEKIAEYEGHFLIKEPSLFEPEYQEYINSVKTALFFQDWIDEKDEQYLLEHYDARPGEIRVKLDLADWLLYSAEEFCKLLHFQKVLKEIIKTRFRVKYGVREELMALLRLKNIGRVRARKLFSNKIKDIGDVKKANIVTLVQILGRKTAIDVKEQVGEKIEKAKVPEKKRKGQVSLLKY